jgi:DNA-binding FadR family transcriptional regulator
MKELIQSDLDFHLALTRAPHNPILAEFGAKLLFPLFAFIQIRVLSSGQGTQAWSEDLENHRLIINIIREGNPHLAAQFVQHCVGRFATAAYKVWGNIGGSVGAHSRPAKTAGAGRRGGSPSQ